MPPSALDHIYQCANLFLIPPFACSFHAARLLWICRLKLPPLPPRTLEQERAAQPLSSLARPKGLDAYLQKEGAVMPMQLPPNVKDEKNLAEDGPATSSAPPSAEAVEGAAVDGAAAPATADLVQKGAGPPEEHRAEEEGENMEADDVEDPSEGDEVEDVSEEDEEEEGHEESEEGRGENAAADEEADENAAAAASKEAAGSDSTGALAVAADAAGGGGDSAGETDGLEPAQPPPTSQPPLAPQQQQQQQQHGMDANGCSSTSCGAPSSRSEEALIVSDAADVSEPPVKRTRFNEDANSEAPPTIAMSNGDGDEDSKGTGGKAVDEEGGNGSEPAIGSTDASAAASADGNDDNSTGVRRAARARKPPPTREAPEALAPKIGRWANYSGSSTAAGKRKVGADPVAEAGGSPASAPPHLGPKAINARLLKDHVKHFKAVRKHRQMQSVAEMGRHRERMRILLGLDPNDVAKRQEQMRSTPLDADEATKPDPVGTSTGCTTACTTAGGAAGSSSHDAAI